MSCPLCASQNYRIRHSVKNFSYLTCSVCGVTFLFPFPGSQKDVEQWYRESAYFKLEEGNCGYTDYLSLEKGLYKTSQRRNSFLAAPAFWENKEILEVGCALGFYADTIKKIKGANYTGLDLNEYAIKILRQKGFYGILGAIENIPQDAYYDIIAFFDVLEHIPDPFIFLSTIRGHLKNPGHILFTTPSTRSFLSFISGHKWVSYIVPHHVLLYNPETLKKVLVACGFENVRIAPDIQWVPLSFLNDRIAALTGIMKNLTPFFKRWESRSKGILVPVSNGQMLVSAQKSQTDIPCSGRNFYGVSQRNSHSKRHKQK